MQNERQSIEISLKNSAVFSIGEKAFLDKLIDQSQIHIFPKGHVIFTHEEQAKRFFIIKSGWVKLYRETLDGTQAIIDIINAGQMFGEAAMFSGGVYNCSAEAAEEAMLVSLPLALLKSEIETNGKLALALLQSTAQKREEQSREIEHQFLQNASQRIGCFILRLANQNKPGGIVIHLPYDKMLVAARLGMQPETFSRALAKLREETGIRVKGATVEMDSLEQLSNYACSACSSGFPCKDKATVVC